MTPMICLRAGVWAGLASASSSFMRATASSTISRTMGLIVSGSSSPRAQAR